MKIFFTLLAFYFPLVSFAQTLDGALGEYKPSNLVTKVENGGETAQSFILSLLSTVVDLVLFFAGLAAFLMLLYAGFQYVTAFGSEDSEGKAKKTAINALLGLLLVISSYLIIDNVDRFTRMLFGDSSERGQASSQIYKDSDGNIYSTEQGRDAGQEVIDGNEELTK